MKVSVVMCVYNAEKYVSQSIESILFQTYNDFEFIILDDCSTDSTLDLVKKYQKQDTRIKVITNNENKGLTYSLNKAIEFAKGEYIARMDADDISHKQRLEKQVGFLERNNDIAVLGTCAKNINEEGIITGNRRVPLNHTKIEEVIKIVNPLIHPSVMFRKKRIEDIGGYDNRYRVVQDYELWFRCIEYDLKLANLPYELIYYRVNDNYLNRKSLKYRITDLKIRYNAYRRLKIPIFKRYGILVPIVLGFTPAPILKISYKYLRKIDPR